MSGCIGKTNGSSGCHFTYVSQMDPKGGCLKIKFFSSNEDLA